MPQKVGTENYSTRLMRNVCEIVSSRPTGFFCRFCWNDSSPAVPHWLPFSSCYHYLTVFSTSVFPHSLSCLEILSTTNNLCNFWHSKFQQVSTYAFCSRDDIFTQKWNCSSPNNLCKCTESPSMLSTDTSLEWKLYLS